jgi:hypothetical protein
MAAAYSLVVSMSEATDESTDVGVAVADVDAAVADVGVAVGGDAEGCVTAPQAHTTNDVETTAIDARAPRLFVASWWSTSSLASSYLNVTGFDSEARRVR